MTRVISYVMMVSFTPLQKTKIFVELSSMAPVISAIIGYWPRKVLLLQSTGHHQSPQCGSPTDLGITFFCCAYSTATATYTGWWFGTFFFSYIGNNHPTWLSYFSEGWPWPTNQYTWAGSSPDLCVTSPSFLGQTHWREPGSLTSFSKIDPSKGRRGMS